MFPPFGFSLIALMVVALFVPTRVGGGWGKDIPSGVRSVVREAQELLDRNEYREAIRVLESHRQRTKGHAADPKGSQGSEHPLVHFMLGNCYLAASRPADALSHYEALVAQEPKWAPGWLNLAKCHYDLGRYREAGASFLSGYDASEKKNPETLYYSGVSFLMGGEPRRASGILSRLLDEYGKDAKPEWKEAAVQAYLSCDKPADALPVMEDLAAAAEAEARRRWQEALLFQYLSLNHTEKAWDLAQALVKQEPLEPKWWKALAQLDLLGGRREQALAELSVSGLLSPLSWQEKKVWADLNLAVGIPLQAARAYETLLAERMDGEVLRGLIHAYRRLKRPAQALEWVEQVPEASRDPELLLLRGHLLYEMGRFTEALDTFRKAAALGHRPGQAWLMAGYSAYSAGRLDTARLAFTNAMAWPEQKEEADKLLKQLSKSGQG